MGTKKDDDDDDEGVDDYDHGVDDLRLCLIQEEGGGAAGVYAEADRQEREPPVRVHRHRSAGQDPGGGTHQVTALSVFPLSV